MFRSPVIPASTAFLIVPSVSFSSIRHSAAEPVPVPVIPGKAVLCIPQFPCSSAVSSCHILFFSEGHLSADVIGKRHIAVRSFPQIIAVAENLAVLVDAIEAFMSGTPSNEMKDEPQSSAGCTADAFMNDEG